MIAAAVGVGAALLPGSEAISGWSALWEGTARLLTLISVAALVGWLKEAVESRRALALTDPLTGLGNARAFFDRLDEEIQRSLRYGRVLTLAYMDLDRFKEVNDTLGHSEGDEVLRTVGETLAAGTRGSDATARFGGDEFGILLPETPFARAEAALEKVRRQVNEAMRSAGWPVTLSVGAVTFESPIDSADHAIRLADGLMYAAKVGGGDRIRHLLWTGEEEVV